MNWFKKIKEASGLRVRTLRTGQRLPLGVVALVLIVDIYLISVLFQGIGWTSEKIPTPEMAISPALLSLVDNPQSLWPNNLSLPAPDKANRRWGLRDYPTMGGYVDFNEGNLSTGVVSHSAYRYEYRRFNYSYGMSWHGFGTSKISQKMKDVFIADWENPTTVQWVSDLRSYNAKITQINSEISGLVSNYDSMLREKSAKLDADKSLLPGQADTVLQNINSSREILEKYIDARSKLIRSMPAISKVGAELNRNAAEIKRLNDENERWYAFWVNAAQVLFVLPVFLAALWWHRHTTRNPKAEVGGLVASHMVYVTAVPIVAKVFEFLNYIIPYRLLGDLFTWLWNAGLQYLWSYLLILVGIGIIFVLARAVLNHSKKTKATFYLKCLEQNLCPKTGRRLPVGCRYSPYTGEALTIKTEAGEAYRYAPFNSQTGEPNPEWETLTK